MADEKNITFIGYQQDVNYGDNITLPPGSTYRGGGLSSAMERKKFYDQMKKEAAEAGMSLKDYMAKVKAEMDEMETMMNGKEDHTSDVPEADYVEVIDATVEEAATKSDIKQPNEVSSKRAELEITNKVFKRVYKDQKLDMLAIYNLIKDHFLCRLTNQYMWVAVFIYFKKYLENPEYKEFCTQMMDDTWFGEFKNDKHKACKHEALGTYTAIILERDSDKWSKEMPNADPAMSNRAISAIRSALIDLEVEGELTSFFLQ